jgi:hypothetical protein
MTGKPGGGHAGEYQARQDGNGETVLLDLLAALWLGGPEDDALDLVVYAATCLERVRVGVRGKVMEVGLEEPEGLREALAAWRRRGRCRAHQKRAIDGLLAQVDYEFLQGHGLVVDANEEVAYSVRRERWAGARGRRATYCGRKNSISSYANWRSLEQST